jgi:hypothetical protein
MQLSKDRILVTHTGSLPRGETLGNMLIDDERGRPVAKRVLAAEIGRRVAHLLKMQAEAGGPTHESEGAQRLDPLTTRRSYRCNQLADRTGARLRCASRRDGCCVPSSRMRSQPSAS